VKLGGFAGLTKYLPYPWSNYCSSSSSPMSFVRNGQLAGMDDYEYQCVDVDSGYLQHEAMNVQPKAERQI
jgi:hypothetical protein